MIPIESMNDEQLNNILIAVKKEQQRRKDKQIIDVKEQFIKKIKDIIDLATQLEEYGIGVDLEFASSFECRSYRLPDEDLNITAHVFNIYKGEESIN